MIGAFGTPFLKGKCPYYSDNSLAYHFASLAQLVERIACNYDARGSIPLRGTDALSNKHQGYKYL